jgi:hypothetical protein
MTAEADLRGALDRAYGGVTQYNPEPLLSRIRPALDASRDRLTLRVATIGAAVLVAATVSLLLAAPRNSPRPGTPPIPATQPVAPAECPSTQPTPADAASATRKVIVTCATWSPIYVRPSTPSTAHR